MSDHLISHSSYNNSLINKSLEQKQSTQISSNIWIPLSCLVAVIYACGNTSSSVIAKYGLKARALQSIGNVIGNLFPLIFISYYGKYGSIKLKVDRKDGQIKTPLLKWFNNIYFKRAIDQDGEIIENKWTNEIHWKRVQGSFIISFMSVFSFYFFIMGYKMANIAGLNTGVLMSLFSLKPILTSILFYLVFHQTLKLFEIFGISL